MRALNTPVTKIRRDARGSLTQEEIATRMTKQGYKVVAITVGDFERGKIVDEDGEFSKHYARAIGAKPALVKRAHAKTRRLRMRGEGPFA